MTLPPCPDPAGCTVDLARFEELAANPGGLRTTVHPSTRFSFRVYSIKDGMHAPNPGVGNTRFAPFEDVLGGPVPTLYLAQSLAAALLETVFHNVPARTLRGPLQPTITGRDLLGRSRAQMAAPRDLLLLDLRDDELARLGIPRVGVVASEAEHYACTRRVAQLMHGVTSSSGPFDGIVWHSRQAEVNGLDPVEVAVVFCDRVPAGRSANWQLHPSSAGAGSLFEGAGLDEVMRVANQLGVDLQINSL